MNALTCNVDLMRRDLRKGKGRYIFLLIISGIISAVKCNVSQHYKRRGILGTCLQNVREKKDQLVHNITRYLTVNDVKQM